MKRVIFLDIDGVLCTMRSHWVYSNASFMRHLDPVAVRMVARLCHQTDSQLVLSSTWRGQFSEAAMSMFLMQTGFQDFPPWHSDWKTPSLNRPRGYEIAEWLKINPVDNYVILDDDSDMLDHQLSHFVKTDTYNGFLWEHYQRALKIFGVDLLHKRRE